jgi:broad specificity phosphatase PhoE
MSLALYFLRHGETEYSKSGGFCGELDPELTDTGKQMAREFAAAYQALPWSGIYCSPMKRTMATAKILSESAGLTLQLRDGLKEIKYGEWEGQTAESVKQNHHDEYQRWMTEPAWNAPPGGETSIEISNRASQIIAEIVHKYADGNILIVSHKATIRIILCSLLGIDLGRYRDRLDAPAGSISVVRFGQYGPRLERLGDRSYMSEELQALPGT